MNGLDLESMAANIAPSTQNTNNNESGNTASQQQVNFNKNNNSNNQNLFKEMETIYKLNFKSAMQNLKVKEEDVLEVGKQLFEQGYFTKTFNLPFNSGTITLKSKKVVDELDYYKFLEEALSKNISMDEFNFLTSVRNLAIALVEYKGKSFENASFQEKFDFLMELSTPLVMSLTVLVQPFWALMMITMHKEFVVFLQKKSHQQ